MHSPFEIPDSPAWDAYSTRQFSVLCPDTTLVRIHCDEIYTDPSWPSVVLVTEKQQSNSINLLFLLVFVHDPRPKLQSILINFWIIYETHWKKSLKPYIFLKTPTLTGGVQGSLMIPILKSSQYISIGMVWLLCPAPSYNILSLLCMSSLCMLSSSDQSLPLTFSHWDVIVLPKRQCWVHRKYYFLRVLLLSFCDVFDILVLLHNSSISSDACILALLLIHCTNVVLRV